VCARVGRSRHHRVIYAWKENNKKGKTKKAPDFSEAFCLCSGNRTRTCVRRGGYEPAELNFKN